MSLPASERTFGLRRSGLWAVLDVRVSSVPELRWPSVGSRGTSRHEAVGLDLGQARLVARTRSGSFPAHVRAPALFDLETRANQLP